jgi:hypothetical protein
MARRIHGNSRFEIGTGSAPDLMLLAHGRELYRQLLTLWRKERKIAELSLAADLPPAELQKALDDFVRQTEEIGK